MNAAATAANPSPGRTWNASCPGTPAQKISASGHSRHPADKSPERKHPHRRGTMNRPRRTSACPFTGLPNTYLPGVPYWLRQRQSAADRCLSFCYLKLESNLAEGALEDVLAIVSFDLAAR